MSTEALQQTHAAFEAGATEADWLARTRRSALARAQEVGFPNRKVEAWHWTSVKAWSDVAWQHATELPDVADVVDPVRVPHALAELVFVDGRFVAEASRLPETAIEGVILTTVATAFGDASLEARLGSLAAWQAPEEVFTALNTAFVQDGLWLEVARNVDVPGPIHVITVGAPAPGAVASHLRHLVKVASGGRATVVETQVGASGEPVLNNTVVEAEIEANGELSWQVASLLPDTAHLVHTTEARLARDARFLAHATWLGGAITRANVRVVHAGEGAYAQLDGITVIGGRSHVDNHTVVDHAVPRCVTREDHKAVVGGRATSVFDGLIVVQQDAQQTDSTQSSRNLLLTDTADANAKPTLEIYADDVKCAHGTTVGALDATQLLYLKTRGIPEVQARAILTGAFVADRLEAIADGALKERLAGFVEAQLAAVQEAS